ncbi:hypothetical protein BJX64DRAFT_286493 [Aspergillus heterothallicus]
MKLSPQQETGNLTACLKSYYRSSKFIDMTIVTTGKEFRVHKLLETSTDTVKLMDDDTRFVQVMIDFMYGCDYDSSENGNSSSILFHIGVYQIADKYDVPNLKRHAKLQFENLVNIVWQMDDFPLAIAEAYAATPESHRGLRDAIVRIVGLHISDLLEMESFVKVLERTSGFSDDMAKSMFRERHTNDDWDQCNLNNGWGH